MNTPPSTNFAAIRAREKSEVVVSAERLPGGCILYRLEWKKPRQY